MKLGFDCRVSWSLLALVLFVCSPFAAHAGIYTLSTQPITYEAMPIGGVGPVTSLSGGARFGGDSPAPQEAQVTLPFPVNFYGVPETNMYVSANGYVTLGTAFRATSFARRVIPGSAAPHNLIAVWWDQLVCDSEFLGTVHGPVLTQVVGAAPNRAFVVQWTDCRRYAVTGSKVSAQLWLHESSNVIEVRYGNIVPGSPTSNFTASMGIENSTGSDGTPGVSNTGTVCNPNCNASHFPSQTSFIYSSGPALRLASFTGDASGSPGLRFNAVASVENVGGGDAAGVEVRFWLSDTPTVGGNATSLFLHPAQPIAAGASAMFTLSATMPSVPDGTYHVLAEVDPSHVIGPTSIVGALGPVVISTTAPDAAVGTISVPQRIDPKGTLALSWTAQNLGSLGATAVPYVITLGTSPDLSSGPSWILESSSIDLAAGADVRVDKEYPLPGDADVGRYWVAVSMDPDGTLDETILGNNRKISQGFVVAPEVEIETSQLPLALVNEPFSAELNARGGDGTFSWSVPVGSLPPGLSLQHDGGTTRLAGTPTRRASSTFTLEVASLGMRERVLLRLDVVDRLKILTASLPTWSVGDVVIFDLTAVGGVPPYTWAISGDALPSGVELFESGQLFGSPTEPFDGTVTFEAVDDSGQSATAELALVVISNTAPSITAETPSFTLGAAASGFVLEATGGNPPYKWASAQSTRLADSAWPEPIHRPGEPPLGLALSEDGVVTGAPTEAGSFVWKVTVQDARGLTGAEDIEFTVAPDRALTIGPSTLPNASVGEAYEVTLESDAEGTASFAVVAGSTLPDGLALDSSGRISGTPTREQLLGEETKDFTFEVRVVDAAFRQGTAALSVGVTDPAWKEPKPDPEPGPSKPSTEKSGGCQSAGGELGLLGLAVIAGITILRRRR